MTIFSFVTNFLLTSPFRKWGSLRQHFQTILDKDIWHGMLGYKKELDCNVIFESEWWLETCRRSEVSVHGRGSDSTWEREYVVERVAVHMKNCSAHPKTRLYDDTASKIHFLFIHSQKWLYNDQFDFLCCPREDAHHPVQHPSYFENLTRNPTKSSLQWN